MKLIECQIKRSKKKIIIYKIYNNKPKIGDWFPPENHLISYKQLMRFVIIDKFIIEFGDFVNEDEKNNLIIR